MDAKILCLWIHDWPMCVCVSRGGGLKHTHLNVLYITICNRRQYFTFEQKSRFPPLLNVTKHYVFLFKYNPDLLK
jgi:hypothetical protein